MFRTKMAVDAMEPKPSRTARPSSSRNSKSSSVRSNFTSINFAGYNSSQNNYSSNSSLSTQPSLSRLKDQLLPENPNIYHFSEIRAATDGLSARRFSSSSSSSSWRCTLRGRDVVVFQRKLKREMDTPQLSERLSLICKIHHASIIKLLGASISGSCIYLVYEYVKGASLGECLRTSVNPSFTVLSNWLSRMKIASDIANGLDYIHNCTGRNSGFVHNHIKSSSIVIMEDSLNAQICHFGTAELCGEAVEEENLESKDSGDDRKFRRTGSKAMKLEGTRGYMSPEFVSTGVATRRSDVYAFGVVILELLSGEEALKYVFDDGRQKRVSVIERAREAVNGGDVRRWIDKRLKDSYPVDVAEKMVNLALDCVEDDPRRRPDMERAALLIRKSFMDSEVWVKSFAMPVGISISMGPR
ncbi:lysM domain receptor-like kinase 3 isoform X2 [Punica granatum]|uniref:LysM domain receptor-like kinase 3 isoform X2 n=1 Tax=Punica granatum TaxID=22663 RepID=A0A6P8BV99_PUNGR|nr:lysM domain receptor-like kinase 3 isoform X2 [Punica granatum]